ncbi:MAG TPA: hypothetical protein VKZ59_12130 [Acidobacteriota bacterium]|nr:hypothetical protein [Acidobacteriota bacterium]
MDKRKSSKKADRFLNFLTKSVPEAEVPPFFATRVAARVRSELPPLTWTLQRMAARMVPVLTVLVMAVTALIYRVGPQSYEAPFEALFVEESGSEEEITVDYVLGLLLEPPGEDVDLD